jgi:3-methylcrotonyl-CoA carboxylase beta subunit
LAGPPLVETATGEVVSAEDLGRRCAHAVVWYDHLAHNDLHALGLARAAVKNLVSKPAASTPNGALRRRKYPAQELYGVIPTDTRNRT